MNWWLIEWKWWEFSIWEFSNFLYTQNVYKSSLNFLLSGFMLCTHFADYSTDFFEMKMKTFFVSQIDNFFFEKKCSEKPANV